MSKLLKAIQTEADRLDSIVMEKDSKGYFVRSNTEIRDIRRTLAKLEFMEETYLRLMNFTEFNLKQVGNAVTRSMIDNRRPKEANRWMLRSMLAKEGFYLCKAITENKILSRFGTIDLVGYRYNKTTTQ